MALRALILLHAVDHDLEPSIDTAVIEVESEAADLEGLAAAFMLAGVDARIQLLQHLVVARKEGAVEDFGVAQVDGGFHFVGRDHNALVLGGQLREYDVLFNGGAVDGERLAGAGQAGRFRLDLVERVQPSSNRHVFTPKFLHR